MTSSTNIAVDRTRKLAITLPKSIIQKIEKERGDISRSKYIRRALESYLEAKKEEEKQN
jgi:metal-responsive CopG/Arc/MetJ family transcriptional regulator